jgi:uncharacterized protein YyaL (SSP411 family)
MSAKRLRDATSPYLQQHAENPVAWWPWCDEALSLARHEDKPILLSIGYSACHWCHVMAHESFEDPATAELMNALYVNIKVDREERPDLDKIYQTAHQLLSRRPGGWPLTVFLTPDDHSAFFAGTYFPPQPRHGLPAFRDLLRQIEHAFREQRAAIDEQNDALRSALRQLDATEGEGAITPGPIERALGQLESQFDTRYGGFGGAPKFPHPGTLRFLLRESQRRDDLDARQLALHTLEHMARGGIRDHLAGGFCRYSVDEQWMIPHFEKMLYDNGQLLALYAEAWAASDHRPLFQDVCERTAAWLTTEMQSPLGGYYSSLDADSEGEEGRYYVWTPEEVAKLLDPDEYPVFAACFGLDRPANFDGRWHLHRFVDTEALAQSTGLDAARVRELLHSARHKLLAARANRVRPGRDEKILTSWNALAIRGMAVAGRLLDRPEWIDSAERALRYLIENHWQDERLLASSRDGKAQLNAYLDDYSYLIDAVLAVLQARWHSDYLDFAVALGQCLLDHFEDPERGGFFFTSDDHETLLHRPKPLADDATPSGNGVAIEALQELALLSGDIRLQQAAERALQAAWTAVERAPYAHVGLLEGLRRQLEPGEQLIIRGDGPGLATWQRAAAAYRPDRTTYAIPATSSGLPDALAAKRVVPGKVVAYRCRGNQCEAPFDILDAL